MFVDLDAIVDQLKDGPHPRRSSVIPAFFSLLMGRVPKPHLENPVFLDPEGSQKPFAPHYEQFIKPEIDTFEHQRIATLKSFGQRSFGALCLLVAAVIMGIVFTVQGQTFHFFEKLIHGENASKVIDNLVSILFITFTAIVAWCYLPVWRYKGSVKKTIFPHIFSFFGDDFRYVPDPLIEIERLKASGILPKYNKSILTDSIQGSHYDVTLDILWAHLKKGYDETETNVFKGIFICLSMNKWFSGKTIVKRDRGLMNWADKPPEGLEKVNLEDPRFEEDFEVYASNQIEARYLLTPSFMERLQGLSNLFWGADVQASFYNQNLLLMIPLKKRYFSAGSIFQPATFTEEIQRILEEMNLIFKIIEELKLHEKTGV
jgi:hypothetical protein